MAKALQGLEVIGSAIAVGATAALLASTGIGIAAIPFLVGASLSVAATGVAMEAGALADALSSNRGSNLTTRQPAANRQIVLGMQRVGGIFIYKSTTGSHHD